ncbi:MAG TPA: hypothetical protein VG323_09690 [Thermoanaerobaculia bacterium]|nr:hypothetical protein [Thermoanaerobaculia bacterium]
MARFKQRSIPQRLALGAVAGAAATFVMQGMMMASKKYLPESKPPMKKDPGEFMVEKVGLPDSLKPLGANTLRLGYGMTSGAIYAALRPRRSMPLFDGALLGLGVWAVGYLGWLPATELTEHISEHEPKQIIVPIVQHAIFGVAVAAAYDGLMRV